MNQREMTAEIEAVTEAEAETTRELKAYAQKIASELPERLLKGDKVTHKATHRKRNRQAEIDQQIEQSYDQLTGDWLDWLEIARRYEHRVTRQDRLDVRHNILIELNRARQRDKKPLPMLRACRIASLTVALYWREQNKANTRVCVFNGYATELHCRDCRYRPKVGKCAYLGIRPVQSLEAETTDSEGHRIRLLDTVATDRALDLPPVWTDITSWLLGCPSRLVDIASKKLEGKPLTANERQYLSRYRKKEQKSLF